MKTRISVQERLKDLRVERGLNLEELAQETGISKSASAVMKTTTTNTRKLTTAACSWQTSIRCRLTICSALPIIGDMKTPR